MKVIVLAAGYGTRLYPLTKNTPKALLEVGGKTILEHILEKVLAVKEVESCCIVSNDGFYKAFKEWAGKKKESGFFGNVAVDVLNDMTTSNDNRLGAIGDISFALNRMKIDDDVMVLGSDNLFRFDMRKFVSFAMSKKPMASVAFYDIGDISKAHLYGIGKIDAGSGMLVDFLEKPKDPPSTLAATAIYFYPREVLGYFAEYMSKGASKDAPGNFVKYLVEKKQVFGYVFKEKWYDIGDIESLKKADNEYLRGD